ncbi:hypothetical protein [uncultured Gelidibacter sp.]|uniref:hypothetical protein n=1 Tax=uncultured Gelidibacter sp. TaxID=259318 RepID=UPI00260FB593|nr:hypothetical protein [uncultured Gelidibacter sp.]
MKFSISIYPMALKPNTIYGQECYDISFYVAPNVEATSSWLCLHGLLTLKEVILYLSAEQTL